MRQNTDIKDFKFRFSGYGHYEVTYKSPTTGKEWSTVTNDTLLIDATKNSDAPKRKDLDALKRVCKNG